VGRARAASGRTLFCDASVLVRILTGDPPAQARRAARAIEAAAAGGFSLIVPDVVLTEVAYVLSSLGMARAAAADLLGRIIDLPGIEVADGVLLRDAVALWAEGRSDFADAHLAALARRFSNSGVLSFNRDFDRIEGVRRSDPRDLDDGG